MLNEQLLKQHEDSKQLLEQARADSLAIAQTAEQAASTLREALAMPSSSNSSAVSSTTATTNVTDQQRDNRQYYPASDRTEERRIKRRQVQDQIAASLSASIGKGDDSSSRSVIFTGGHPSGDPDDDDDDNDDDNDDSNDDDDDDSDRSYIQRFTLNSDLDAASPSSEPIPSIKAPRLLRDPVRQLMHSFGTQFQREPPTEKDLREEIMDELWCDERNVRSVSEITLAQLMDWYPMMGPRFSSSLKEAHAYARAFRVLTFAQDERLEYRHRASPRGLSTQSGDWKPEPKFIHQIICGMDCIRQGVMECAEDLTIDGYLTRQARFAALLTMALRHPEPDPDLVPTSFDAATDVPPVITAATEVKYYPYIKSLMEMELSLEWTTIDYFLPCKLSEDSWIPSRTQRQYDLIMPEAHGSRPPEYSTPGPSKDDKWSTSYRIQHEGIPQQLMLQNMRARANRLCRETHAAKRTEVRNIIKADQILVEVEHAAFRKWTQDQFSVEQEHRTVMIGPKTAFLRLIDDGQQSSSRDFHDRLYKKKLGNTFKVKPIKYVTLYET